MAQQQPTSTGRIVTEQVSLGLLDRMTADLTRMADPAALTPDELTQLQLQSLPPTSEMLAALNRRIAESQKDATRRPDQVFDIADVLGVPSVLVAQWRYRRAQVRDWLQDQRRQLYPDCWCLGVGGEGDLPVRAEGTGEILRVPERFCSCPDGQALEGQMRQDFQEEFARRQRLLNMDAWRKSGIGKNQERWMLDTHPGGAYYPKAIAALRQSAQDRWDSWLLIGGVGTGKTGLALGYAFEWLMTHDEPIVFREMATITAELRETYRQRENGATSGPSEMDLITKYAEAPLLVIDDLGAEQLTGTGWLEDRLGLILGRRHANGMPVMITTNYEVDELTDRIGNRLMARLLEMTTKERVFRVGLPKGVNLRRPRK
jgi:DNA replication protein DnaC